MKVKCNKCGQNLVVSEDLVGEQVRCPRCEFVVEVTVNEAQEPTSKSKDEPSERTESLEERTGAVSSSGVPTQETESQLNKSDAHESEAVLDAEPVHEQEPLPWETAKEWFLKIPEGLEFGPNSLERLDQWVTQGRVSASCKVRYDKEDWQAAGDFYPELVEDGNPFGQKLVSAVGTSAAPVRHLEPHRGTLVLSLAIAGCVVPFLSVWPAVIGTRDLRLMSLGKMDPSGDAMTRSGQAIAMVASMIWFGAFAIGLLAILIATMNGLSQ